jgi:ABC-type uncharacterized transport system ATPase subunit
MSGSRVRDIPFSLMPNAIAIEDVTKLFRDVAALNGLNMVVPEGSIFGLVGPNGAGKTTAIKIVMNVLHATSGRAQVLCWDSRDLAGTAFCSIGYVSENQRLPEWMRVTDFLAYVRNFYPTWDRELENELVKRFDLPAKRKLKTLSRGMRMKAALASSLAYRPRLVVMDETFQWPRSVGSRRINRMHTAQGWGGHPADLFARPSRDRDVCNPHRISRSGTTPLLRRIEQTHLALPSD